MRRRLVVLLAVLAALPAPADAFPWRKVLYRSCQVVAATGHGLDLTSSMYVLGAGKGIEQNVLYGPNPGPVRFALIKVPLATGSLIVVDKLAARGPTETVWGAVLNCGAGVAFGAIGFGNIRRAGIGGQNP